MHSSCSPPQVSQAHPPNCMYAVCLFSKRAIRLYNKQLSEWVYYSLRVCVSVSKAISLFPQRVNSRPKLGGDHSDLARGVLHLYVRGPTTHRGTWNLDGRGQNNFPKEITQKIFMTPLWENIYLLQLISIGTKFFQLIFSTISNFSI